MTHISWSREAAWTIADESDRKTIDTDLRKVFAGRSPTSIIVQREFQGFSVDRADRVILAVDVATLHGVQQHIVKIGRKITAEAEFDRWKECIDRRGVPRRVFVNLDCQPITDDGSRQGIIMDDANVFFGRGFSAATLEEVVIGTVFRERVNAAFQVDPESLERVIWKVFESLSEWLYSNAMLDQPHPGDKPDGEERPPEKSLAFYERRTVKGLDGWVEHEELRRQAIWLFDLKGPREAKDPPTYLDPIDLVGWAIRSKNIPSTLVGMSHGDLHGRNILTGTSRRQADYPSIIDYGEMGSENVIAWDFAKLEMELKVRLFPMMEADPEVRRAILGEPSADSATEEPDDNVRQAIDRVRRYSFYERIERELLRRTREIRTREIAEAMGEPTTIEPFTHPIVRRVLWILERIRREAAVSLGFSKQRAIDWHEEYQFALAAYSVACGNPNWRGSKTPVEIEVALVTSGVAAASLQSWTDQAWSEDSNDWPSYRPLMTKVFLHWKSDEDEIAERLLASAKDLFPHAVPLVQTRALVLADRGRLDESLNLVQPMTNLCGVFKDHELWSRLGRAMKGKADEAWEESRLTVEAIKEMTGRPHFLQCYLAALEYYLKGYDLTGHYYPCINAATLIAILNRMPQKEGKSDTRDRKFARNVLKVLSETNPLADADGECWIYATEGEASILLEEGDRAAEYYGQAIKCSKEGVWASMYAQLCRLHWILGDQVVGPSAKLFFDLLPASKLAKTPWPFNDCGRSPGSIVNSLSDAKDLLR